MNTISERLEAGDQAMKWRNFCEGAWEARAKFMEDLIASGETNPVRIINLLHSKERKFQLSRRPSGEVKFQPRPTDRPDIPMTPAGTPLFHLSSFAGNLMAIPPYSFSQLHLWIVDFMDKTGPYDALIELGCGFGRNLFQIYYSGGPANIPYFGGELTSSGTSFAQKLASLDPHLNFSFFQFDFLQPDFSHIKAEFKRPLIFTMHAIEQVTRIGEDLFKALIDRFPGMVGMHFEPFGFQFQRRGPISDAHKKFFEDFKWNQDLFHVLKSLHDSKALRVAYLETEQFLPTHSENPSSLVIWEPRAESQA